MTKMAKKLGSLVNNTFKLVHGWQNNGQQKHLFYKDGEDTLCPAGCDQPDSRTHFIQCTVRHLQAGHIKRRGEFKKTHGKLCIVKVTYDGFMRIFISLRCGDAPLSNVTYFESDLDKMVQHAWMEQREIEWDHIIKGRIIKYWGIAQGMFYQNSPETRGKDYYSASLCAVATVLSLLDFSLHLINDKCASMRGVDEDDTNWIIKELLIKRVGDLYGTKDEVEQEYGYLFREGLLSLRKHSTQYLIKWVPPCVTCMYFTYRFIPPHTSITP